MKKKKGLIAYAYNCSSYTLRALCLLRNSCCFVFISSRFFSSVTPFWSLSPLCSNSFTVLSSSSLWFKKNNQYHVHLNLIITYVLVDTDYAKVIM